MYKIIQTNNVILITKYKGHVNICNNRLF